MKPAISILMANYNKGQYIAQALESVIRQTNDRWELIIIDDASTDDSVAQIEPYLNDKRIKFYHNLFNEGTIKVQKKLVDVAQADIVGILDSDDALAESAVEKILKAYSDYPDCGFIYSQCYYCDEHLRSLHLGFSAALTADQTNLHCNSVLHFKTFEKALFFLTSGYDELMLYAEDIDLIFKLEEVTELYFIDQPLYYYRILPKSQTHSFKNTRINRSSTALAKLNAYERRLGTDIPNLNRQEISEVLFWGIINSVLAGRWQLVKKFFLKLFSIDPLVFFQSGFYKLIFSKIKKIIKLKKEKPLLKI